MLFIQYFREKVISSNEELFAARDDGIEKTTNLLEQVRNLHLQLTNKNREIKELEKRVATLEDEVRLNVKTIKLLLNDYFFTFVLKN